MSTSLREAKRKIQENNFPFDDLPDDRNDVSIWNRLLDMPYNLSVPELSALKNDRCPLPGNWTLLKIGSTRVLEVVSTTIGIVEKLVMVTWLLLHFDGEYQNGDT